MLYDKSNCTQFVCISGTQTSIVSTRLLYVRGKKESQLLLMIFLFFFFIGWKVIPDELFQHSHSYFIVLTALFLIVPIKRRCQCYFFVVLVVVCVRLHSSGAHQVFLKLCKGYARNLTSVKYAAAKLIPL